MTPQEAKAVDVQMKIERTLVNTLTGRQTMASLIDSGVEKKVQYRARYEVRTGKTSNEGVAVVDRVVNYGFVFHGGFEITNVEPAIWNYVDAEKEIKYVRK